MHTINIDFEVYKAITAKRATEDVTDNDVLRETFGLPPRSKATRGDVDAYQPVIPEDRNEKGFRHQRSHLSGWTTKGVTFPIGTEFRGHHRGETFIGTVETGGLRVSDTVYGSPSAAAVAITGNSVNGWIFWECRFPGSPTWKMLKSLRH